MITTRKNDVLYLRFDVDKLRDWNFNLGIFSDIHYDSVFCDRKLFKKHLDLCLQQNRKVFINGDLLDLMQGRTDNRSSKSGLRTEYKTDAYVNSVVNDVCKFLKPYKDIILAIGIGNHESKFTKWKDVDVIKLVGQNLGVPTMGYGGYIVLMVKYSNKVSSYKIKFNHGKGGSAPVTKGFIDQSRGRWAAYDMVTTGHTHYGWIFPHYKETFDKLLRVTEKLTWYVKTPSYQKKESGEGWTVENDFEPAPRGFASIDFHILNDKIIAQPVLIVE